MGLFFTLAPLPDPGPQAQLRDTPRLKSFLWALGLPIAILFADWNKWDLKFDKTDVMTGYYFGFLVSTLGFIFLICVGIYLYRRSRITVHQRDFELQGPFDLAFAYAFYGPTRLMNTIEADRKKLTELHAAHFSPAHLERIAQANRQLALLMNGVSLWRPTQQDRREGLIDDVLNAVEAVVRTGTRNPQQLRLRVNYMEVVPFETATQQVKESVAFDWPPYASRTHLIVLRRYSGRLATGRFALAVAEGDRPEERLFGAVEAYQAGEAIYVDKLNLQFAPRIPRSVSAQIRRYLNPQPFRTFVSVPTVHLDRIVGVINVESDRPFLTGGTREAMDMVIECLQPYSTILGQLLAPRGN